MYKAKNVSSSETDPIIGDGGLVWGFEYNGSPDELIQTSFIHEMSSVSSEVRDLLETIKSKELILKRQETLLSKRQLKVDMKENELKVVQQKVDTELIKLEQGSLHAMSVLEKSIAELKRENQRLRDSFQSMSKDHTLIKSEVEMVQSKNAKLEKQLSNANGRIKNFIKLQNIKLKENRVADKENTPPKEKPRKVKPQKVTTITDNSSELINILMKALSNVDQDIFAKLFDESLQQHYSIVLSSFLAYLRQMSDKSVVMQYPCLKLTLKCISVMSDSDLNNPSVKAIFRKLTEVLCVENQFSNSRHLHSRLLSSLVILKTSVQIQVIQKALKQILLDLHEDGAREILLDNAGYLILLSNLNDPLQHASILNVLILLTLDMRDCEEIIKEIISHIPKFIEMIEEGNPEVMTSVSILLQRISTLAVAKYKLRQTAPLFRHMINENGNSLIELNFKAVLMNIDCFHQVPIS